MGASEAWAVGLANLGGRRPQEASTRVNHRSGGHADHLPQGSDPQYYPFAPDLGPVRPAVVLMGEFVYVVSRCRTPHLPYDFSAYLDEAIGVFPFPNRDRHPRVTLDVLELLAVHLGVDQKVFVVGIDPHHLRLGVSTWQQRRECCEVFPAGQFHDLRVEILVVLVVSYALASSGSRG